MAHANVPAADLFGIWGSGPDDIYSVGDTASGDGIILHSGDRGATWAEQGQFVTPGWRISAIWGSGANDVYAFGDATVFHTDDGGANWTRDAFATTEGATIEAAWGTSAADIYAVGTGGYLAHFH